MITIDKHMFNGSSGQHLAHWKYTRRERKSYGWRYYYDDDRVRERAAEYRKAGTVTDYATSLKVAINVETSEAKQRYHGSFKQKVDSVLDSAANVVNKAASTIDKGWDIIKSWFDDKPKRSGPRGKGSFNNRVEYKN